MSSHEAAPWLANWMHEKGVCEELTCSPSCSHSGYDPLATVKNGGQHQGTSMGRHRPIEGFLPGDGM